MLEDDNPLLEKFIKSLDAFKAALDKYAETTAKEQQARSSPKEPRPPQPIKFDVSFPPAVTAYYEAKQHGRAANNKWRWIERGVTLLAFFAAVALAVFTYKTLRQVKRQADSAQAQVGIMRQQLEAADRAWIKATLVPSNGVTFTNNEAHFSFSIAMKNIGRSVATACVVRFKFLVSRGNEVLTEPIKQQAAVCGTPPNSNVKDSDIDPIKASVFPDDSGSLGIGGNIAMADIERASLPDSGPLKGKFFVPFIVGCVDYGFSTVAKHHQTGFIYQIMRIEPNFAPLSIEIGKALPAERIHLERYLFGGDYAY